IPTAVGAEFIRQVQINPRFAGLALPQWIRQQAPLSIPSSIAGQPGLDSGEAAAIALALQIQADAVLIDEDVGRSVAIAHGIRTYGVLGVLLQAKQAGLVTVLAPILQALRQEA